MTLEVLGYGSLTIGLFVLVARRLRRSIISGPMFFTAADNPTQPLFPELTDRERDVLRLVAEGQNNPAIARSLFVAPKTVANHVSNILTKLHFADRAEASVTARRAGLTTDRPGR